MIESELQSRLALAINKSCAENDSDTPDFILAKFLVGALEAFNTATRERESWHGRAQPWRNEPCVPPATGKWQREMPQAVGLYWAARENGIQFRLPVPVMRNDYGELTMNMSDVAWWWSDSVQRPAVNPCGVPA